MRLDEPDPVEAWKEHLERLAERATQLNDLHADALRYRGPGTDLTVGLLSAARWMAGGGDTSTGIYYIANMPTEEVFTSPDARRTEGTIRSSLPLVLSGQVVRGLELTFEQGRAVRVEAETGADLVRSHFATIENADRLGEVALVTKESRVGQSATLFHDTLFDENATCHIAYGAGFPFLFDGDPGEGLNVANMHVDFMVGGLELDEALTYSPGWLKTWAQAMAGNAQLGTSGNPEPELLADLDGERVGRAMPLEAAEIARRVHGEHRVNWSGVGAPTQGWAREVLGEPDVEQLWELVAFCFRLDEPDPVAAWREHLDRLDARAAALTERRPDALRYRGPGTDFTVGLLPSAHWGSARFRTAGGIDYVANMPTEEIFITPDSRRAEGP